MGKVGANLVVYNRDNLIFGSRTGVATAPVSFSTQKRGIGCVAPYSIVEVLGTNVFLGRDDFYVIEGTEPISIGSDSMRYHFFDNVSETEIENTWGFVNNLENETIWIATTTAGKKAFVWNYQTKEWYLYSFAGDITGAGRGAV
jgi:hypothetical protein